MVTLSLLNRKSASLILLLAPLPVAASEPVNDEFFERRVRPVLADNCFKCHSGQSEKLRGDLRLDTRAHQLKGGELGPALVPGKPAESLLYRAMAHLDADLTMPPKKPRLPEAVIENVKRWIEAGAPWPGAAAAEQALPGAQSFDIAERKAKLSWVWQAPQNASLPPVTDKAWPRSEIDHFILARLEEEGLKPSDPAAPEVWLRRVHFALTGLPPTPEALQKFLKDGSPSARAAVVDGLLASPRFGERWARHWMDLVRYAESRGHEGDYIIPNAHEYRDYVIRALNDDIGYDAFVREHIAGDLMPQPRRHPEKGFNESVLATGWAYLGEEVHSPVDIRLDECDRMDNKVDVFSKTFLGMTVACARCHDHKFDAISQEDYYSLVGFFISSSYRQVRYESMEHNRGVANRLDRLQAKWMPRLLDKYNAAAASLTPKREQYILEAARLSGTLDAADEAARRAAIEASASERMLDPVVLSSWTANVEAANKDSNHPLHPFAKAALGGATEAAMDRFGAVLEEWKQAASGFPLNGVPASASVVVDYGDLESGHWMADGFAFGLRPVQPGDPWVGREEAQPVFRIFDRGAARFDPGWSRLDLSAGVERDPTGYGGWKRAGCFVRTPKFEVKHGRLFYLVKGSGRAFAVVDSHRMQAGPLHGQINYSWKNQQDWRWVSHNLTDYKGHRVSIEFSPADEHNTMVAMVVDSPEGPGDPLKPNRWLLRRLGEVKPESLEAIAHTYAAVIRDVLANASDAADREAAQGRARLVDWLYRQPHLVLDADGLESCTAQSRSYMAQRRKLEGEIQWKSKTAPAWLDGNGVNEYVLVRGSHARPIGEAPRRFLEAISGAEAIPSRQGSGRLELAGVLTDPSNPLVARVMVNRIWHHIFGRGIVASVDNFGFLGQRPTHPELLDHLAYQFVHADQWSIKRLIRRMVLSQTYAMTSRPADAMAEEKDPQNLWLHRMNLKRLEGEAIRDAILSVSGRLSSHMYGPGVPLHASQFIEARGLRRERGPLDGHGWRSIYTAARRNFFPMMMQVFDTPVPFTTMGRRNVSNVPAQMLYLMNDPFVYAQAKVSAERLEREMPEASESEKIRHLFRACYGREATSLEVDRCRAALKQIRALRGMPGEPGKEAWVELCHALFGVKEFIYLR